MATASEVKTGFDEIARKISEQRGVMVKVKTNAGGASGDLDAIPTNYAEVIATINSYAAKDAFEAHATAEFAKLTEEFLALKADAHAVAVVDLG